MKEELREMMRYLKMAIPIKSTLFEVPAKVGENSKGEERIFGSVNSYQLVHAIKEKTGFYFLSTNIEIPFGIKTTGYYEGNIKFTRNNMECKKTKFVDEKAAEFYINKLKVTSVRNVKPVRAYLCMKCTTWHLTSKPEIPAKTVDMMSKLAGKYEHIINEKDAVIEELKNKLKERGLEISKLCSKLHDLRNNLKQTHESKEN